MPQFILMRVWSRNIIFFYMPQLIFMRVWSKKHNFFYIPQFILMRVWSRIFFLCVYMYMSQFILMKFSNIPSLLSIVALQEFSVYRWWRIFTVLGDDLVSATRIYLFYNIRAFPFRLKFSFHWSCDIHRADDSEH